MKFFNVQPFICPCCLQPAPDGLLCAICASYLTALADPCPLCATPNCNHQLCGKCLQQPPPWDELHIAWDFSGVCRFLIHQFKYQQDFSAGRALTHQWPPTMMSLNRPDCLMATPMHHAKFARKGYNHAAAITKILSKQLNIPVSKLLIRSQATPPLEGLNKKERRAAVHNAFSLKGTPPKRVALIDDVFTSGATAEQMTRLLKRAGTQHVSVWALARTPFS